MSKFRSKISSTYLILWNFSSKIKISAKNVIRIISFIIVSIIGLAVSSILMLPTSEKVINNFQNIDTIFVAIGGMLGTILILAFSLSIIPIQRSVEYFTPSISYLYREDGITKLIFILIAVFTLFSFLSIVLIPILCLSKPILLAVIISFVGIAFDLIRWHHRRVSLLIEPATAINKLTDLIKKFILKTQHNIEKHAKLTFFSLTKEEKENTTLQNIQGLTYRALPGFQQSIENKILELSEIAHKSISRNEVNTTYFVLNSLADVFITHFNCRKDNFFTFPAKEVTFMALKSDIDGINNYILDRISDIADVAIRKLDQTSCLDVVSIIKRIIIYLQSLQTDKSREHISLIISAPLFHLGEIIEKAQLKGLDDVVLTGSKTMSDIGLNIQNKANALDIDISIIDRLTKIIQTYFFISRINFINIIAEKMLMLIKHLIKLNHFQLRYNVSHLLSKMRNLFPLALLNEQKTGAGIMSLPFSAPYDLVNEYSIGHLVNTATTLIKKDKKRKHVNPYSEFVDFNYEVYWHFFHIAEENDFGNSSFMHHFLATIRTISDIYLNILQNPLTNVINDIEKIVNQLGSYMAFFWKAFEKSKKIKNYYAYKSCNLLAYNGLKAYTKEIKKVGIVSAISGKIVYQAISNITTIIKLYCKTGEDRSQYNIADLIMYLWYLRIIALDQKDKPIVQKIDEEINKLKDGELKNSWQSIFEAFQLRHDQFSEEIKDIYNRHEIYEKDDAIGLVREILQNQKHLNTTPQKVYS